MIMAAQEEVHAVPVKQLVPLLLQASAVPMRSGGVQRMMPGGDQPLSLMLS